MAVATLFFSGRVEDLALLPVKCVALESTLEEYRRRIRRLSSTPGGYTGKRSGYYCVIDGDAEATVVARRTTVHFLDRLSALVHIATSDRLADLSPRQRRTLVKLFGTPTAGPPSRWRLSKATRV